MIRLVLFTFTMLLPQQVDCSNIAQTYKRWLPNTNFDNPVNWNLGRLPCPNDRVLLPQSVPPIYMNDASVREIVLPTNGEIILDSDMSLSFSTFTKTNDTSCPGDVIKFNRTEPADWFDPENWCYAEDASGQCMASQPTALDTSRIPAQFDSVVLPKKSSFFIDVDGFVDVFIKSLSIAGKKLSSRSFSDFRQSPTGRKQFVGEDGANMTKFVITNEPCDDVTGCASGNEAGHIIEQVCSIVSPRCSNTSCSSPILPDGDCCRMCGALIQIEYNKGFNLSDFESFVRDGDSKKQTQTVELIISKMSDGTVHIILKDTGEDTEAMAMAKRVVDKIKADMAGEKRYKIATVTMLTSESPMVAPLTEQVNMMSSSSIVGIILSIITVIMAVAAAMYCFVDRGRCQKSMQTFTRFGRKSDKQDKFELYGGTGMVQLQFPDFIEDEMQGIENPVYDVPQTVGQTNPNDPDILDPSQISFVCDDSKGFNNPLFEHNGEPIDPTLRINPAYSMEYMEQDSQC